MTTMMKKPSEEVRIEGFLKITVIQHEMKSAFPRRLSTRDLQQSINNARTSIGLDNISHRTVQRSLNMIANSGMVYGDGEFPQGWRLTPDAQKLMGLIPSDISPSVFDNKNLSANGLDSVCAKIMHAEAILKDAYPDFINPHVFFKRFNQKFRVVERTMYRLMYELRKFGLVESKKNCSTLGNHFSWRLTPAGCILLGVEVQP